MFPARAGMSLVEDLAAQAPEHVPRASGDEPEDVKRLKDLPSCSPRERG